MKAKVLSIVLLAAAVSATTAFARGTKDDAVVNYSGCTVDAGEPRENR